MWLANNATLEDKVLAALHSSVLVRYSRFPVTYKRIKFLFLLALHEEAFVSQVLAS
jgi:hypothetical protein